MRQQKQVQEELGFIATLRDLCLSYEEISVMRMQKIRGLVLTTRSFYDRLSRVYYHVKSSYKDRVLQLEGGESNHLSIPIDNRFMHTVFKFMLPGSKTAAKSLDKQEKSLSVFISANAKLYGSIVDEVAQLFTKNVTRHKTDIMIIGKLGRSFYKSLPPPAGGKNYLYFEVPDLEFSLADLKAIVYHLQKYKHITVYFGQYQSMLTQVPTSSSVTGDLPQEKPGDQQHDAKYLFEPSLETIVHFFETQIFSALFKQTMHENQLARFASRVQAMERALTSIDKQKIVLKAEKRNADRLIDSQKQLQRIAGVSLWGGKL